MSRRRSWTRRVGRIGLMIAAEGLVPEVARSLMLRGAEIILWAGDDPGLASMPVIARAAPRRTASSSPAPPRRRQPGATMIVDPIGPRRSRRRSRGANSASPPTVNRALSHHKAPRAGHGRRAQPPAGDVRVRSRRAREVTGGGGIIARRRTVRFEARHRNERDRLTPHRRFHAATVASLRIAHRRLCRRHGHLRRDRDDHVVLAGIHPPAHHRLGEAGRDGRRVLPFLVDHRARRRRSSGRCSTSCCSSCAVQTGGQYVAGVRLVREDGTPLRAARTSSPGGSASTRCSSAGRWRSSSASPFSAVIALVLSRVTIVAFVVLLTICIAAPIIALVSAPLDRQNRALHDRIVGVVVVPAD